MLFEEVIAKLLVAAWGLSAMYMVWGMEQDVPTRYPLLFGLMSMCLYFVTHELPVWIPGYVSVEIIRGMLYTLGILIPVVCVGVIAENYQVVPSNDDE